MIPGFVLLGAVAVLFQLIVVGALWAYLRHRHPVEESATRRRVRALLAGGACIAALGQLAALGAIGSLRSSSVLTFDRALLIQDLGLSLTGIGYLCVVAGLVVHGRASG